MNPFSTCFHLFSWLQYYLSKAKCNFLVAEFDSSIVGFIAVDQKSETMATVSRMSVDTCFRGKRKLIATRLLQEAFRFCQECGYEELLVEFPGLSKTKTHRLRHCDVKPTRQEFSVARQGWTSRKRQLRNVLTYDMILWRHRESCVTISPECCDVTGLPSTWREFRLKRIKVKL